MPTARSLMPCEQYMVSIITFLLSPPSCLSPGHQEFQEHLMNIIADVQSDITSGDQQPIVLYSERVFVLTLQSCLRLRVYSLTINISFHLKATFVLLHLQCHHQIQHKCKYKQAPIPGSRSSSLCLLLLPSLEGYHGFWNVIGTHKCYFPYGFFFFFLLCIFSFS